MITDIRKPPMPEGFMTRPRGTCRWCGEPVLYPAGHKRAGQPDERRNWHAGNYGEPNCVHEYKIVADPSYARRQVFKRDGGKCHDCGTVVGVTTLIDRSFYAGAYRAGTVVDYDEDRKPIIADGPFCQVHYTERQYWEVDHAHPLWLVDRSKPFEEIIQYWQLGNLLTRCTDPCHKEKSAEEAAARAKGKRIRGETGQGRKAKIQSRGFDKRFTKKLNGQVVPRETVG